MVPSIHYWYNVNKATLNSIKNTNIFKVMCFFPSLQNPKISLSTHGPKPLIDKGTIVGKNAAGVTLTEKWYCNKTNKQTHTKTRLALNTVQCVLLRLYPDSSLLTSFFCPVFFFFFLSVCLPLSEWILSPCESVLGADGAFGFEGSQQGLGNNCCSGLRMETRMTSKWQNRLLGRVSWTNLLVLRSRRGGRLQHGQCHGKITLAASVGFTRSQKHPEMWLMNRRIIW